MRQISQAELSIVIGVGEGESDLAACLAALTSQAPGEILVVRTANEMVTPGLPIRVIDAPTGTLMPGLWKIGLDQARGTLVAFTTAGFVPAPDWVARIVDAFSGGDLAGIGGVIDPPEETLTPGASWAVYFARYSLFLPMRETGASPRAHLPGENAAYRRADLDRYGELLRGGFWETLLQARLADDGRPLLYDPALRVRFGGARHLPWRARLQHGRHYGRTRSLSSRGRRAVYAAASPFLAPLLLWRIFRRVPAPMRIQFVRALPGLYVLIGAWSIGEAAGYVSGLQASTTSE